MGAIADASEHRRSVGHFSLDALERAHRSVLSGQRICQLYCFMLLYEWLTKPISAVLSYAIYALTLFFAQFSEFVPGPAPSPDLLSTQRSMIVFITIAVVWLVFLIWSDYRRSYPALALCI
ncbi:MAG: hypothetical protein AAFN51_13625, partial [Pseudomonadota bacterium]